MVWTLIVNKTKVSAGAAGSVSLGGELAVHRIGFGAMRITGEGIWGPPKNRKVALALLRRAVELGINFIDTADSYGPSISEQLIAEALYPYPADLVIATKGGWNHRGRINGRTTQLPRTSRRRLRAVSGDYASIVSIFTSYTRLILT
jgi:pyridoxine 4-dehydrogenase